MSETSALQTFSAYEYRSGRWQATQVAAPAERSLTLYLNGQEWAVLLASPHDPLSLALGYLANEGVLTHPDQVTGARVCDDGAGVDVRLNGPVPSRPRVRTTGCGRGLTRARPEAASLAPLDAPRAVTPAALFALLRALREQAVLYAQAGGVHAAGLGTPDGALLWAAEDVGRHNAVDRVRGLAWRAGQRTSGLVLVTTGRISAEMLVKAVRMGCGVVASRTAATAHAVALARQWQVTLVAYARSRRMRVYAHPWRLALPTLENADATTRPAPAPTAPRDGQPPSSLR